MQRTAPHSVSPLRIATTFNLQPRALSGAVADLVSRQIVSALFAKPAIGEMAGEKNRLERSKEWS